jgi:surface polysaccharide O-acyltransferase-like enzyme
VLWVLFSLPVGLGFAQGGGVKSLKLISISAICAVMSIVLRAVTLGWNGIGSFAGDFIHSFVAGYWFLWAYVALTLLAPILNAALEGERSAVNARVIPLFVLIFGWAFLTHVPGVKSLVPQTSGVGALSCLMMASVYLAARIIRLREYDRYLHGLKFWGVVGVSAIACAAGFSHYDSPFALIVAVGLFQFVRKLSLPEWLGRVVMWVAPSMFAVYILHQAYRGFGFVGLGMEIGNRIGVYSLGLQTFVAAVVVFTLCVAMDSLRRCTVLVFARGGAKK